MPKSARAAGSAAVEFVMMAPLVLILSAFIWDLRAYIAHRTDLAREVYVIAEIIAGAVADPFVPVPSASAPPILDEFIDRFARRGAGSLDVAVVARGPVRRDGTPCPDPDGTAGNWCPPRVFVRWPATPADGLWRDAGQRLPTGADCAPSASTLPDENVDLAADVSLLPNEASASANESDWLSRRMFAEEWWVVVDVCLHPGPGVFTGRLIQAGYDALDFGSYTTSFRAAWRSIHDAASCDWCNFGPTAPATP